MRGRRGRRAGGATRWPAKQTNPPPFSFQEAAALTSCHADHPVAKFWGVCNDAKHALDACFRREKAVKRAANAARARREQERLLARKEAAAAS